jgi:undecaprenyl-diphosphatase
MNGFAHSLTGVHWSLYTITDWLGLVPIAMMLGFAVLGLIQWIRRKRLLLVDRSLLVLGGFYIAVAAAFLFFEIVVVNTRPVLIGGVLEASYPSSTTVLSMCVVPTAMMQLRDRMNAGCLRRSLLIVLGAFTVLMVVFRFFSGVHWLSDILGGALLSVGLVTIYAALTDQKR